MGANELTTGQVAEGWFGNAAKGDFDAALALVSPDVEWNNIPPVRGVTDLAPWLGSYKGLPAVIESFKVWGAKSEMKGFELLELTVEGERAVGIVHEHARCLANGNEYDLYVATCLVVRGGRIVKWQVYWDPSPLVAAYRDIQ